MFATGCTPVGVAAATDTGDEPETQAAGESALVSVSPSTEAASFGLREVAFFAADFLPRGILGGVGNTSSPRIFANHAVSEAFLPWAKTKSPLARVIDT